MEKFQITRVKNPKAKPADEGSLGFGKVFTDHMFRMDYSVDQGWHNGRIIPYAPFEMDPAAVVFHYAQELFEGLKAFKTKDGDTLIFRPMENIRRMNATCQRICIPVIDEDLALEAIKQVVAADEDWIPKTPGTSLYIRPYIIATEAFLGVHPAKEYAFIIILSPSGHYYPQGLAPTKIYVESEDVRATVGGTGFAKIGANYAISLRAQVRAEAKGYNQVLWLDGVERKYVEEIGAANAFFVIDGVAVTSPLTGTILPGITRKSVIEVLKEKGIPVEERRLSIDELIAAAKSGILNEVFATGTAAVIAPVGNIGYKDENYVVNNNEIGKIAQMLYDTITQMQRGALADIHNWTVKVD